MLLFYLHNLGFSDPFTNLIALGISLVGWISSTILVPYGAYSLIRYWDYLSYQVRIVFLLSPVIAVGILSVFPWHHAWLSFPFGFFAGFPLLFIFDSREW